MGRNNRSVCRRKKWVFSLDLKEESEDACLTLVTEKKRVPNHRSNVLKGFLPHFDLLDLNEEERAELSAFVNNHDSDSDSGDELDDGNLPLFYIDARDLNGQVEIMFCQHRMTIAQTILGIQV